MYIYIYCNLIDYIPVICISFRVFVDHIRIFRQIPIVDWFMATYVHYVATQKQLWMSKNKHVFFMKHVFTFHEILHQANNNEWWCCLRSQASLVMQFLDLLVDIPQFGLSNWPNQLVGKGGSRATWWQSFRWH